MVTLNEDHINPNAAEVYYQTPEDLKNNTDEPKVVVHDDDNFETMGAAAPVSQSHDIELNPTPVLVPEEQPDDVHNEPAPCCHDAMNPIDMAKMNPDSIVVAGRINDEGVSEFYVDFDDVRHYAELNETSIMQALNDIITCNEEYDMTARNMMLVMSESSMDSVEALEEAGVNCIRFIGEGDISMDVEIGSNDKEVRVSEDPNVVNPLHGIKAKYDTVVIAQQDNNFFVDAEDVQKCADIKHESVIDTLNGIIQCNEDAGVTAQNLVLVMNENVRNENTEIFCKIFGDNII